MTSVFGKSSPATEILSKWWSRLKDDRGARAELQRCDSPTQVSMAPAYQRLCRQLRPYLEGQWQWENRLAAVIGLLAHVKEQTGQTLAKQMAGNPPIVSELRFRRLLQRNRNDIYGAMIRILRMLDGQANLPDLMTSVFDWGDAVRKRWAFDYFPNTPEKKTV